MTDSPEFDWDADFQRSLPHVTIREIEIEAIEYAGFPDFTRLVEKMLTSAEPVGISIIIDNRAVGDPLEGVAPDDPRVVRDTHFRLDGNVPFGKAWEFPSFLAYEIWIERGCPGPV